MKKIYLYRSGFLRIVFLLILLAIIPKVRLTAQLKFKHITIDEGLSQNSVLCMVQDREGYIWIGTEDGLNRYDGYEFRYYKHDARTPKTVSNSIINAIAEDKHGNLWIGTADGLNRLDKKSGTFTRIKITSEQALLQNRDFINSLFLDTADNLWIGTIEGLKCYSLKSGQLTTFSLQPGNTGINTDNRPQAIFKDSEGQLWVGTTSGLFLYNPANGRPLKLPPSLERLQKDYIRVIKQDSEKRIWFGSETRGVFVYDPADQSCVNFTRGRFSANGISGNTIRDIFFKSEKEVWLGTPEGLGILNATTGKYSIQAYNSADEQGISHNSIRNFLKDNAGNIWLGTYAGGINVYYPDNLKFNLIPAKSKYGSGLTHPVVSSILEDESHNFWIGTEGGGLNYYNEKQSLFSSYRVPSPFLNSNNIKSLAWKNNYSIWVGTYNGLNLFNIINKTFTKYSAGDDRLLGSDQIYALVNTPDGLWIGTNGGGLRFLDHSGSIQIYRYNPKDPNSLSSNNINVMIQDPLNNLWIGTQKGLNYFDTRSKKCIRYYNIPGERQSLSNNSVLSLYADSRHRIWIGTEGGGLNLLDPKANRFYAVTEADGIGNDVIHAINEDANGNIWVSSNKGLSRIKLNKLYGPFASSDIEVLNYIAADGLQSNQFSTGAGFRSQNGTLYFGGINGISWFDPDDIIMNTRKPAIVFTDIRIRNKKGNQTDDQFLSGDNLLALPYDHGSVIFRFAALNFITPEKNKYAYRLQGLENDEGWHYVDARQRLATYTNLSPGTYYFRVKASNNDGIWNTNEKVIKIIVSPPFWKTWWAYLIYLFIIGGLLYLFYHYSLKTARLKSALQFEHLNHEKDMELAQQKINFFTNISHEIKTPLTLILTPLEKIIRSGRNSKIKSQLQLIQRNGERLSRLVNQLLDFRKLESGKMTLRNTENDLVEFLKEICLLFEGLASQRNITVQFESSYNVLLLWFDAEKLERVLYNLLSNAVKFGRDKGTITVRLKPDSNAPGFVCIEVEDDGIGIDKENQFHLFDGFQTNQDKNINSTGTGIGLAYSKGLVELLGGTISVSSRLAEEGRPGYTCLTVKLPVQKEYLIIDTPNDTFREDLFYRENRVDEELAFTDHQNNSEYAEKQIMLVVEDNNDLLLFMADTFSKKFIVYTAGNGKEGMLRLKEIQPDIIISDVMLPEMDGITFCKKVKADFRTSHIPFILLTARTPVMYKIEGYETGADDYITKPFSLELLEVRIDNLIASRKELAQHFKTTLLTSPQIAITSPDDAFLAKVMAFIEDNVTEPVLNVEQLAKELCMSRGALYRKVKALTGQTTIELIRGIRIKIAARLLLQKTMNINEVVYSVGFTDADYFRKCFKEQFGVTPREYMNQKNTERIEE
ncbi:hypothetical protein A8C56_11910 [Niabella ginsenosidivorans]|uniref:histidine kinase n=1 Tax=Niabella ginsenosidivorans TaxID=1176587 RepID=A0A1A9I2M6_9BACT|nr:hybrid sensor histidine kinase/response regulator transcription factor [Niabella ginsenosidivorans]ANH81585.1 hypothetical protein A8C56_11910 [Niabella ginsenosidivorans]